MPRSANREKILTEGLRVIHERGFARASVRDIAQAANVPLGSFTSQFPSKEAFGLEVLNRYREQNQHLSAPVLLDKSVPVRTRIKASFDRAIGVLSGKDMRGGCLLGNFYAEVTSQSDALRERLTEIIQDIRAEMKSLLEEGVASGELRPGLDCDATAGFIYASLEGAILLARVQRSPTLIEECRDHILRDILN